MAVCPRHGSFCPYDLAAREAFDAWVATQKRSNRGEVTTQELRDARRAYDEAREERVRECFQVTVQ